MEDKQAASKTRPRIFSIYILILVAYGFILLIITLNQEPVNQSVSYSILRAEVSSTTDTVKYTWHVVVAEPVRITELRYLGEQLVNKAKADNSFNALEILIYDYPQYIGHGYTLARVIFAPQGDLRKADTVKIGDYNHMSIQWDLREKIWENRLSQEEVLIWKAWQDYYQEQEAQGVTLDKNRVNEVIAAKFNLPADDVSNILSKQEYWRYSNFDYITR